MARLSFVLPTEVDKEEEEGLLKAVPKQIKDPKGGVLSSAKVVEAQLPQKRARGGGLSAAVGQHMEKNVDQMAAMLKGGFAALQTDKPKKKKKKTKTSASKETSDKTTVEVLPVATGESAPKAASPSRQSAGAGNLEVSSPSLGEALGQQEQVAPAADAGAPTDLVDAVATTTSERRLGKELVDSGEVAAG